MTTVAEIGDVVGVGAAAGDAGLAGPLLNWPGPCLKAGPAGVGAMGWEKKERKREGEQEEYMAIGQDGIGWRGMKPEPGVAVTDRRNHVHRNKRVMSCSYLHKAV